MPPSFVAPVYESEKGPKVYMSGVHVKCKIHRTLMANVRQEAVASNGLHTFLQSSVKWLQGESSYTGSSGWKPGASDPGVKPLCPEDMGLFSSV